MVHRCLAGAGAAPSSPSTASPATMPGSKAQGAPPLSDDAIREIIQPMLHSRDALLKMQRKATCWMFFRAVGVREGPDGRKGNEDTMLSCRICRPSVVDLEGWDTAIGSRSGLVRYSRAGGTSLMRTHVRNCHSVVSAHLERVLALATISGDLSAPAPNATQPGGKKRKAVGDGAAAPLPKRRTGRLGDAEKAELCESVRLLETTLNSAVCALSALKRRIDSL